MSWCGGSEEVLVCGGSVRVIQNIWISFSVTWFNSDCLKVDSGLFEMTSVSGFCVSHSITVFLFHVKLKNKVGLQSSNRNHRRWPNNQNCPGSGPSNLLSDSLMVSAVCQSHFLRISSNTTPRPFTRSHPVPGGGAGCSNSQSRRRSLSAATNEESGVSVGLWAKTRLFAVLQTVKHKL